MDTYEAKVYTCNGSHSVAVMARTRVTPLKKLTLPQLKLMAKLIASHIRTSLSVNKVVFWSDSQTVLHWLYTTRQLKRFVQNRISEIRNLTSQGELIFSNSGESSRFTNSMTDCGTVFIESTLVKRTRMADWLTDEEK